MELNQNVLDECTSYLKSKYKSKLQTLKLEHCTDVDGEYIYLVCIKIKKQYKERGYGSLIMSEVIQLADLYNVRIRLYATNIFGAELQRLYEFYQRQGFVLVGSEKIGEMLYHK